MAGAGVVSWGMAHIIPQLWMAHIIPSVLELALMSLCWFEHSSGKIQIHETIMGFPGKAVFKRERSAGVAAIRVTTRAPEGGSAPRNGSCTGVCAPDSPRASLQDFRERLGHF